MRVISGKYKGKSLKAVRGMKTRPTSDKVKEALFHRIGPYFTGGNGLDLYAGTGSLGIEALSRGLDNVIFVDKHPQAVKIIKQNLKAANIQEVVEVYCNDAARALQVLQKRSRTFDYIFMDPPYAEHVLPGLMETISENTLLKTGGRVMCEHSGSIRLPDRIGHLEKEQTQNYGDTTISFYITE